jgi:hypothetical protein
MGLGRFMLSMSHRSRRYELELKLKENRGRTSETGRIPDDAGSPQMRADLSQGWNSLGSSSNETTRAILICPASGCR